MATEPRIKSPVYNVIQRKCIKTQNKIAKSIFNEATNEEVIAVTRNNKNQIFIISRSSETSFSMYALCFDTAKNRTAFYHMGEVSYGIKGEEATIHSLTLEEHFRHNGNGSILLQAAENEFVKMRVKSIELDSRKDYDNFSKKYVSIYALLSKPTKEIISYLENQFYDKNLYFYQKNGYIRKHQGVDPLSMTVPVKKTNLHHFVLDFGMVFTQKIKSKEKITTRLKDEAIYKRWLEQHQTKSLDSLGDISQRCKPNRKQRVIGVENVLTSMPTNFENDDIDYIDIYVPSFHVNDECTCALANMFSKTNIKRIYKFYYDDSDMDENQNSDKAEQGRLNFASNTEFINFIKECDNNKRCLCPNLDAFRSLESTSDEPTL